MSKRKVMAVLMAFIMVFTMIPTAFAKEDSTKISREKVIEIASKVFPSIKDKKNIVANLVDYWEPNEGKIWNINFQPNEDIPSTNVSIIIDANNGSIKRFDKWEDYGLYDKNFAPKFTRDELKAKADEFINSMQPNEFKQVVYKEEPGNRIIYGRGLKYPIVYSFWYIRKVGDILYSRDGFRVNLNATTGEIVNYEFNWSTANLPTPENTLSLQKAQQEFLKNVPIMLMYMRPWVEGNPQENRKLKLVYSLPNGYYGGEVNAIDAKTGKPLNWGGRETQLIIENLGDSTKAVNKKIDKLPKILNRDEAKAIAEKELQKHGKISEMTLSRSDYVDDNYGSFQKLFIFSWSKVTPQPKDNYTVTINIDAETGAVTAASYEKNDPNIYRENQTPPSITWEDGLKKAKEFVISKYPEFKDALIFMGSKPYYPEEKMGAYYPPQYYYNFTRVVNGVIYPENSVYVAMNTRTGEMTNYGYRWEYIDFPAVKNIVTKKQAEDTFIKQIGLQLNYRQRYDMPMPNPEGLLVYEAKPSNASYIDAYTGKIKTYDGKDLTITDEKLNVSALVKGQREAILLYDMGILAVDNNYKPEKAVTKGEFIKMLVSLKGMDPYYFGPVVVKDFKQYINAAASFGWITNKESITPEENITRQEIALILANFMGYGEIINKKVIYVTFNDKDKFTSTVNAEAAAIIKALGVMQISGNDFEPSKVVNYAEAAKALYNSIERAR
jgi:hypothetical protein